MVVEKYSFFFDIFYLNFMERFLLASGFGKILFMTTLNFRPNQSRWYLFLSSTDVAVLF